MPKSQLQPSLQSYGRFMGCALVTVLLVPAIQINFVAYWSDIKPSVTIGEFLTDLRRLPIAIVLVTLSWRSWVPIFVIAATVGFGVWRMVIYQLSDYLPLRILALVAALVAVGATLLIVELWQIAVPPPTLILSLGLSFSQRFGVEALITAIAVTQLVYRFRR